MANKAIFGGSARGKRVPKADTKNAAGGLAYSFTPEHALAQLAFTGTFNDTFYQKGVDQLQGIRQAADQCSPTYVAQCAIAAREQGYMKDMPAALAVMLSKADPVLLRKVFPRVIDNGKQVRNFVQFIRSGVFGRKSLGSGPKKLIRAWLASRSDYSLFRASVGNDPSLADIIKMVHPKPETESRRALYAYLIGKPYEFEALPEIVQAYERFKKGDRTAGVPNVEFRMLTSLPLTSADWAEIAKNGRWHQTRMNLNTYARQGVFEVSGMVDMIAEKLKDEDQIRKARVFPYQLLAAFLNTGPERNMGYGYGRTRTARVEEGSVPAKVRLALQDAMEIAVDNVPAFEGRVCVVVDTSGSMSQSVTGYRKGASSKVSCVDVAALVAATVQRKNPLAVVIPVDTRVHRTDSLNPRDSIMTNASKLAKFGGGGTRLGAAMQFIETAKAAPDLIIMVSDNESWVGDATRNAWRGTETLESFRRLQNRNPALKMVNIDIVANTTSQTPCIGEPNILNIGGFSDQIWETIRRFVDNTSPQAWVDEIKAISLD
jgi:60 kDa SS-A/Ro ribonucleoprotein